MQFRLILVGACLSTISSGIAASFSLQPEPNLHTVRNKTSDDSLKPIILKFDLSKDGVIVRYCYGAHLKITKERVKNYWILPAECLDKTKYDSIAVKHGYADNFRVKVYLDKNLFHDVHPGYDEATKAHNIALLRLPSWFYSELRHDYKSVELPSAKDDFATRGTLELFEYTPSINQRNSKRDTLLLSAKTKPINSLWCEVLYPLSPIKEYHICASGLFNKGLLQSDCGTPLVARDGESFKLLGLATIIRPWANRFFLPMEFLSIHPYIDWINTIAQAPKS